MVVYFSRHIELYKNIVSGCEKLYLTRTVFVLTNNARRDKRDESMRKTTLRKKSLYENKVYFMEIWKPKAGTVEVTCPSNTAQ